MAERRGETGRRPLRQRLLWFAGLWLAGVLTVAAVAALLKLVLQP